MAMYCCFSSPEEVRQPSSLLQSSPPPIDPSASQYEASDGSPPAPSPPLPKELVESDKESSPELPPAKPPGLLKRKMHPSALQYDEDGAPVPYCTMRKTDRDPDWEFVCFTTKDSYKEDLKQFQTPNGFKLWVTKQGIGKKVNNQGVSTNYYQCSGSSRNGCPFKVKVLHDSEVENPAEQMIVYKSAADHSHPTVVGVPCTIIKNPGWGIPTEWEAQVDKVLEIGLKPAHAYRKFKKEFPQAPVTKKQFQTRRQTLLHTKGLQVTDLGGLTRICEEKELTPTSPLDTWGVLPGFLVQAATDDRPQVINITFSTVRLMGVAKVQASGRLHSYFSIDGTYKLVVGGFPVTQGGTVNADRSYEPMTITVANSENSEAQQKTLQNHKDFCNQLGFEFKPEVTCPDAGPAGMDALEASFPGIIRGTCYSHCIRKGVEGKNLLIKPKRNFDKIVEGIKKIHSTTDNTVRDYSIELWVKQWKNKEKRFVKSFVNGWMGERTRGWNVGATPPGMPKTNQAIERNNRSLKDYVSGHVRLPLRDFIRGVGEELEFHSREFAARQFVHVPTLKKPEWGAGQLWLKFRGHLAIVNSAKDRVVVPSSTWLAGWEVQSPLEIRLKQFKDEFRQLHKDAHRMPPDAEESLEDYVDRHASFYVLNKLDEPMGANHFECTCAQYYKGAWCKHSIGVTMKLKLAKCPEKWVIDSVEALRKRGRPKEVGHCMTK